MPRKKLTLQCDASSTGLGACLMQDNHPIAYAARSVTSTEQNYAQIEKETLATVFEMEHLVNYTYGLHVTIQSDHKPLEIIVRKNLHNAHKRLRRMLIRLQKFYYSIEYLHISERVISLNFGMQHSEENKHVMYIAANPCVI
jgi:hypothetical protein